MIENTQREHYNRLNALYDSHYYDNESMRYRREFIYSPMFQGLDLNNKDVLEIGCGTGHNAVYLKQNYKINDVYGCDISDLALEDFDKKMGTNKSYKLDFLNPINIDKKFDVIYCVGVVHHLVKDLDQTFKNIDTLLKPGGTFIMMEPNARFMNTVRNIWYKLDSSFDAENEAAIFYEKLRKSYLAPRFQEKSMKYMGGPAFFIILQSMILRIPFWFKRMTCSFWMKIDQLWNKIMPPPMSAYFIAQWTKKS